MSSVWRTKTAATTGFHLIRFTPGWDSCANEAWKTVSARWLIWSADLRLRTFLQRCSTTGQWSGAMPKALTQDAPVSGCSNPWQKQQEQNNGSITIVHLLSGKSAVPILEAVIDQSPAVLTTTVTLSWP